MHLKGKAVAVVAPTGIPYSEPVGSQLERFVAETHPKEVTARLRNTQEYQRPSRDNHRKSRKR